MSTHGSDSEGQIAKPTEFVKLVTIQESEHQIISAYEVHDRRPPDVTLWTPALDRHIETFRRAPHLAAADRGFASATNEEAALARGVRRVILPQPGRKTPAGPAHERQRSVADSGCESDAKAGSVCSNADTVFDAVAIMADGTARWVGLGVIADNLVNTANFLNARAAA